MNSRLLWSAVILLTYSAGGTAFAQDQPTGEREVTKPVVLRIGVPRKQNDREVVIPLIVEMSGSASVGRIKVEMELAPAYGWEFRRIDLTRGLELRSNVRKRNESEGKLVIEWDLSGEGKELPIGHVGLLRIQAERGKSKATGGASASDNPPTLKVQKLSWGLAEFERQPETLPQLETPDNYTGNPDVTCFFFTH